MTMNNSGNNPVPLSGGPSASGLEEQLRSLQSLLSVILVSMIVVSGSVLVYLSVQKRGVNRQIAEAQRAIDDYEKVRGNIYIRFVSSLQDYAKSHPDLNPLLEKYGFLPNQVPAQQVMVPAPKTPSPSTKKTKP